MSRKILLAVLALAVVVSVVVVRATGQDGGDSGSSGDKWEYLVVAGASGTNLSPSGSPSMRKEPSAGFGREAFVLEQQLDKLGAKGWELVAVEGSASDPVYFFKRRK